MKQKDIAMIIVVAAISAAVSFGLGHVLFQGPKNRGVQVEVVDAITTDFTQPNSKYLNASSINPTQLIRIGENTNLTPFNTSGQ